MPLPPMKGIVSERDRPPKVPKPSTSNNPTHGRANKKLEPLRAVEPLPAPLNPLAFRAQASVDTPNLDEEQLSAAYTVYLQSLLVNMMNKKVGDLYSRIEAEECAEIGVDVEIGNTGCATIASTAPLALLIMKVEHLIKTDSFGKIYSELAQAFVEEKTGTLDQLQQALEVKFSGISLKDLTPSSPMLQGDQVDLDELITRVKDHLAPQEKSSDTKSFLIPFSDSLKELLRSVENADKNSSLVTATKNSLMDVKSKIVSSNLVDRKKNKNKTKTQK